MSLDMNSVPAFVGTLPGWITSVSCVSILGLVFRWQLGLRRLKIEADKVELSAQEVANTADASIREHFATEVRQLRERMDQQGMRHQEALAAVEERYRRALAAADERNESCQRQREEDRGLVEALRKEVDGLRSQLLQNQKSALALFPGASPEIRDAADRAVDALDKRK